MVTYAPLSGRVTYPNSDVGLRALVTAVPQTQGRALKLDDRITMGVVTGSTDLDGTFVDPLNIPVVEDVIWHVVIEPINPRDRGDAGTVQLKSWVAYVGPLEAAAQLDDLASTIPLAVSPALMESVLDARDSAAADAAIAQQARADAVDISNIAIPDDVVEALVKGTAGAGPKTRSALSDSYAHVARVDAEKFKTGSRSDLEALEAAFAAATTLTRGAVVQLSARTWDVEGGLSLAGFSCGLVGTGAGHEGGPDGARGTVLYASSQSGPVLDFTDWISPDSFRGKIEFGNFAIRGSGVADATLARAGIKHVSNVDGKPLESVWIHDIVVSQTGGPCVDVECFYLSEMDRVVGVTPVNAKSNNVPYMVFRGCNGNRFHGLGFRSMTPSADVGIDGALLVTDAVNITGPSGGNIFTAPWFEYLHIPTNGTLINNKGISNVYADPYFVDVNSEAGSSNTCYARFGNSVSDIGGNIWRGEIPGGTSGPATEPTYGIIVSQSRNRIVGTKGYWGRNIHLLSGVGNTYVEAGGSVATSNEPLVIDDSGQTTNVWIDNHNRKGRNGFYAWDADGSGAGPRFMDPNEPANGGVNLGTSGARIQTIFGEFYLTLGAGAEGYRFRDQAGAVGLFLNMNDKAVCLQNGGGLPAADASFRGYVRLVHGGTGVADRLVICRKDAAGAYAWVDLF